MSRLLNYIKMYRELYARELHRDPWRSIIVNALFIIVGAGISFVIHAEVAANGCVQVKGGGCITAVSNPSEYYLYTNWFLVFALLGVIGLIFSIRALLRKRVGNKGA